MCLSIFGSKVYRVFMQSGPLFLWATGCRLAAHDPQPPSGQVQAERMPLSGCGVWDSGISGSDCP